MQETHYDVVIIGSGMAGLYTAHQMKRLAPRKTFIILEKNKKHDMGGRAGNDSFYGTDVAIGAGVGRKHKDHLLVQLLKDTKVKSSEFEATRSYAMPFPPVDIMKTIKQLRSEYKKHPEVYGALTFKQFFVKVAGEEAYRRFVLTSGYTDYEVADTYETLYKYGMDDNTSGGWTAISIPWARLVTRLHDTIGKHHFKFSSEVTSITDLTSSYYSTSSSSSSSRAVPLFQIETSSGATYYANKVVVATTISGVQKILRSIQPRLQSAVYQKIHGQPFLMVYAKFDSASREILKQHVQAFTVVNGPLQKLIPMNPDKGVYMIAYTDNDHAVALKGRLENTRKNCDLYAKWVETALGIQNGPQLSITAIKSYYWSEGTHYYEPLNPDEFKTRNEFVRVAQNPYPGIAVVGEAVSRNQGWVEGALDSVDAVLTNDWLG